jgi:hypothetical protein
MNHVERSAIRRSVRSFATGHSFRFTSKPRQRVGDQSSGERLPTSGEVGGRAIDAGNCCASPSATRTPLTRWQLTGVCLFILILLIARIWGN